MNFAPFTGDFHLDELPQAGPGETEGLPRPTPTLPNTSSSQPQ